MKIPKARQLPSGSWFCRVRVNGADISITRPTEREAVKAAILAKAEGVEKKNRTTLRAAIDDYIQARPKLSPATVAGYRVIQRNRATLIMDKPISDITERNVRASVTRDAAKLSPKTLRNTYGLIGAVLTEQGGVDISRIRLPSGERTEKRIYSRDEIAALLDALRGDELEAPVLLALMLGLRRSEICALRWDRVDIENRRITIDAAVVLDENRQLVTKETKTRHSTRTLENCPERLIDALDALPRGELVVGLSPDQLSKRWTAFLARNDLPHIGLHALRHTFASIMLSLGVGDLYTMSMGGWATDRTLRAVYQHTMSDAMTEAERRRNDYFDGLET